MKCMEVKENLDAFFDDGTDFLEMEKIRSHMENCPSCRTESESLRLVGETLRQNLFVPAPASLDEKVFNAFRDFHARKRPVEAEEKQERAGWFVAVPRFAAAVLIFALCIGAAFQLGRISAGDLNISLDEPFENNQEPFFDKFDKKEEIKIVEVPVIKKVPIEVPVVKERIVIRTVYVDRGQQDLISRPASMENTAALNSSVKDGEYLTTTNLEGFQPVAEIKARVTKKEMEK